jgi:hypothetical protein
MGAGLLVGCSSPAPEKPPTLPSGVSVSILQNRDYYGPRRLEIAVTNDRKSDFEVTEVAFHSARFTGAAPTTSGTLIPGGTTRNLRVQLGTTSCDPSKTPDTVRVTFTRADGSTATATVEPSSPFHAIETVVAQDCAEQLTAEHVGIALAGELRTVQRKGHPVALLDVTFTPTGAAGTASIAAITRTILLRPADGSDEWPLDLHVTADSAPTTVTLDIVPANCRLHTVTEDKRGTYFPFTTTTDAGDGLFYLAASNAVKEQFYAYIATYCGWDADTPLD